MSHSKVKFVFFGTPSVSSKTLDILKRNGYMPKLIVTSPDSKKGRGLLLSESPVSKWAKENNIKCLKPDKIDEDFISFLSKNKKEEDIDIYVVVAYGKILPENMINIPPLGTINIHYSLLPLYRGASPLEVCLLNGDEKTGITIQQMRYKLDSGPILVKEELGIGIEETKEDLREELINLGANCLCDVLPLLKSNDITPTPQEEQLATYCKKIKKEDGEINPDDTSVTNWNKYRAYLGWPGLYFFKEIHSKKIRFKITKAKFENNSFVILKVVREGGKEISYEDFKRTYDVI